MQRNPRADAPSDPGLHFPIPRRAAGAASAWRSQRQIPSVDEAELRGETPRDRAFRLSEAKAEAVAARYPEAIVIGGDQVPAASTRSSTSPATRRTAASS